MANYIDEIDVKYSRKSSLETLKHFFYIDSGTDGKIQCYNIMMEA